MRILVVCVAASLTVGAWGTAKAQMPTALTTNSAAPCELHFWGGMASRLLAGPSHSQDRLAGDLPLEAQAASLEALNLPVLLKMPDVRLVVEDGTISRWLGKQAGPRLTYSKAPCYAELIVDSVTYTSHITGREVGARFWLRRYAHTTSRAEVFKGATAVKVRSYPAKRPEDRAAALAELHVAFGQAVEGFLLNKVR